MDEVLEAYNGNLEPLAQYFYKNKPTESCGNDFQLENYIATLPYNNIEDFHKATASEREYNDIKTMKLIKKIYKHFYKAKDKNNISPIHLTCMFGKIETTKYLINVLGHDVNTRTNDGFLPIHYAYFNQNIELAEYLLDVTETQSMYLDLNICLDILSSVLFEDNDAKKAIISKLEDMSSIINKKRNLKRQNLLDQNNEIDKLDKIIANIDQKERMSVMQDKQSRRPSSTLLRDYSQNAISIHSALSYRTPIDEQKMYMEMIKNNTKNKGKRRAVPLDFIKAVIDLKSDEISDFDELSEFIEGFHFLMTSEVIVDADGRNALYYAALKNKASMVRALSCAMSPSARDNDGNTALHAAAEGDFMEVAQCLLELGGDELKRIKNNDGCTPFNMAKTSAMQRLLNPMTEEEQIELAKEQILSMGEEFDSKVLDPFPNSSNAINDIFIWAARECPEFLLDICKKQPDMGTKDADGNAVVHILAIKGMDSVLAEFIPKCDTDDKNKYGQTPLHLATINRWKNVVKLILENTDAEICIDNKNNTPIKYAIDNEDHRVFRVTALSYFLKFLVKHTDFDTYQRLFDIYFQSGFPVNFKEESSKMTVLHHIVDSEFNTEQQIEIIERLNAKGADFNIKSKLLHTPLLIAAMRDNTRVAQALIKYGAEVNCWDYTGKTPLHYACCHNNMSMIRLLLQNGAIEYKDVDNLYPSDQLPDKASFMKLVNQVLSSNNLYLGAFLESQYGHLSNREFNDFVYQKFYFWKDLIAKNRKAVTEFIFRHDFLNAYKYFIEFQKLSIEKDTIFTLLNTEWAQCNEGKILKYLMNIELGPEYHYNGKESILHIAVRKGNELAVEIILSYHYQLFLDENKNSAFDYFKEEWNSQKFLNYVENEIKNMNEKLQSFWFRNSMSKYKKVFVEYLTYQENFIKQFSPVFLNQIPYITDEELLSAICGNLDPNSFELVIDGCNSVLHLAVKQQNLKAVEALLRYGAKKELKNANGLTPLDIATEYKFFDIADRLNGQKNSKKYTRVSFFEIALK